MDRNGNDSAVYLTAGLSSNPWIPADEPAATICRSEGGYQLKEGEIKPTWQMYRVLTGQQRKNTLEPVKVSPERPSPTTRRRRRNHDGSCPSMGGAASDSAQPEAFLGLPHVGVGCRSGVSLKSAGAREPADHLGDLFALGAGHALRHDGGARRKRCNQSANGNCQEGN